MTKIAIVLGVILVVIAIFSLALSSSGQSTVADPSSGNDAVTPPVGLGIDRQSIIELFDDDFAFTPAVPDFSGETVEGTTLLGQERIGLFGRPDNLTRILHVAVPEFVEPHEQRMQNVRRGMLLLVVVPEWEDASDWMTSQFQTLQDGDSESVDTAGKRITMDRTNHEGVTVYGLVLEAIR